MQQVVSVLLTNTTAPRFGYTNVNYGLLPRESESVISRLTPELLKCGWSGWEKPGYFKVISLSLIPNGKAGRSPEAEGKPICTLFSY